MRFRNQKLTTFLISFFIFLSALQLSNNWTTGMKSDIEQNAKINLVSTDGLQITEANITSVSSSGTGLNNDPYIIENINIDTTDSLALEFYYVTSHFILRDSSLKGSTYGVYITGISSGIAKIINCTIEGGLSIGGINALYLTIYNCTLRASQGSSFRHGLNFTRNVVEITGPYSTTTMRIEDQDNIIEDNLIYGDSSAIMLNDITDSTIKNNVLIGAGFYMYENQITDISTNAFENNLVNGKPYGFFVNRSDEVFSENQYGQIYIVNSEDIDIENHEMYDVNMGVQVHNCTNVSIRNVNGTGKNAIEARNVDGILVENCNWNGDDDGTQLRNVDDATIQNNYFSNFYRALEFNIANNVQVHNNTIFNATDVGLNCEDITNMDATFNIISCFVETEGSQVAAVLSTCENVTFYYNIFISLGDLMAYPVEEWDVTNVIWYSESLEIGNHYSDWNGLGTYDIEGDGGSIDLYPVIDFDEDDLTEWQEIMIYYTDPFNADSDSDGLDDGEEVNTHDTNPNDSDSDDDGYTDSEEVEAGTDPNDDTSYPSNPYIWLIVGLAGGFGAAVAIVSFVVIWKRRT
jgi:hypothetical protein